MDEKAPATATSKVTIRNVTRSSLSFQVPGESIRLQPGQSLEVHEAYLETTELKTLCKQGTITKLESRAPDKTPTGEAEAEPDSEHTRRTGPRKR